jgi:hypothetical protein
LGREIESRKGKAFLKKEKKIDQTLAHLKVVRAGNPGRGSSGLVAAKGPRSDGRDLTVVEAA